MTQTIESLLSFGYDLVNSPQRPTSHDLGLDPDDLHTREVRDEVIESQQDDYQLRREEAISSAMHRETDIQPSWIESLMATAQANQLPEHLANNPVIGQLLGSTRAETQRRLTEYLTMLNAARSYQKKIEAQSPPADAQQKVSSSPRERWQQSSPPDIPIAGKYPDGFEALSSSQLQTLDQAFKKGWQSIVSPEAH